MITADTLRSIPLLASIPDHERETIAKHAADVSLQSGEWLLREGDAASFFALLEGELEILKAAGNSEQRMGSFMPGDYFGEVPLLLNVASAVGLRAARESRVVRLEPRDFLDLVAGCKVLNAKVLKTMVERVASLQRFTVESQPAQVQVFGRRFDLVCHDLREFLARNHVGYTWIDPDDSDAADRIPAAICTAAQYPVVLFPDGSTLVNPDYRPLAERLGLQTAPSTGGYDIVIVGAGPAGLAAAVYGASEGLRTLLVEQEAPGGQAGTSSRIENYLGFPNGISGDELGSRALSQAKRFGAEVVVARRVSSIEPELERHIVLLDDDTRVSTSTVLVANGVTWRKLEVEGIEALLGRGVYYGAARTEALATRGKDVYLVGGGNSAGQAAMFFSAYARKVTVLVRAPSLLESMSQYLIAQLATKANVAVRTRAAVVAVEGTSHLEAIVIEDRDTRHRERFPTDALFVFIGADPDTSWLPSELVRDKLGYVCTGRDVMDLQSAAHHEWPLERDPYLLESSVPGIFAAGDVRHGSIKRVASGVGEGSMSVAFVHQYLGAPEDNKPVADSRVPVGDAT